jgi:hypothetical protein
MERLQSSGDERMNLWIAVLVGLVGYAAFVIFLGHFLHAGGATRDVRDD